MNNLKRTEYLFYIDPAGAIVDYYLNQISTHSFRE